MSFLRSWGLTVGPGNGGGKVGSAEGHCTSTGERPPKGAWGDGYIDDGIPTYIYIYTHISEGRLENAGSILHRMALQSPGGQ